MDDENSGDELDDVAENDANVPMDDWWVKLQVHGSTEVVKREYHSNRELFNLINF